MQFLVQNVVQIARNVYYMEIKVYLLEKRTFNIQIFHLLDSQKSTFIKFPSIVSQKLDLMRSSR